MNVIMCEHYNCTQDCTTRRQPRKTMPIDNNKEHNRNHKIPSAKHKLQHACCSKHTPPHHQISSHLHTTNFGLFCTNITLNHMPQPRLITTNAIFNKIHTKYAENLAKNSLDASKQSTVQNIKKMTSFIRYALKHIPNSPKDFSKYPQSTFKLKLARTSSETPSFHTEPPITQH